MAGEDHLGPWLNPSMTLAFLGFHRTNELSPQRFSLLHVKVETQDLAVENRMRVDRTKALWLVGLIASSSVACTIVEKDKNEETGGTSAGTSGSGGKATSSGGTASTSGGNASSSGGVAAGGSGGATTSGATTGGSTTGGAAVTTGGASSGGSTAGKGGASTSAGGAVSGGTSASSGGRTSGAGGTASGGTSSSGIGGASSCDDYAGTPSDCAPVEDIGSCGSFGLDYCNFATANLKPSVAEKAVDCMLEVEDTCGGPPYDCVQTALNEACPDSTANTLCSQVATGCSITAKECHSLVDGLNSVGREMVKNCIEADDCAYGLWSCLEGM